MPSRLTEVQGRFSSEHNLTTARFKYMEDPSISKVLSLNRKRTEDAVPVPDDGQDKIAVLQVSEESITAPS